MSVPVTVTAVDESPTEHSRKFLPTIIGISLLLTLTQVVFVLVCSGPGPLAARYSSLRMWDTAWYAGISEGGYYVNPALKDIKYTNTVFPPGLPMLGTLIRHVTGVNGDTSVIVASQLATFVFWIYFLLLARRLRTSALFTTIGVLCVLLYPEAFFFVTGYSDSLFLAMLLGLLYWQNDRRTYSWIAAGVHGCIMTATRFVGIPLVILPVLSTLFSKGLSGLRDPRPWCASALSAAGAGTYFLFCKLQFGEWLLPIRAHRIWMTLPDPAALVNPVFYLIAKPYYDANGMLHPDYLSLMSFLILLLFILFVLNVELLTKRNHAPSKTVSMRMTFYAAAIITWVFTLVARGHNISSCFRYMIVPEILCVLGLMGWSAVIKKKTLPYYVLFILMLLLAISLPLQADYIARFVSGLWVA